MIRTRRGGVALAISIVLATSAGMAAGAETAQKAPSGFHTVKVKKAGFSIAIPDEWLVIDMTRKGASKTFEAQFEKLAPAADFPPGFAAAAFNLFVAEYVVVMAANAPEPGSLGITFVPALITGETRPATITDIPDCEPRTDPASSLTTVAGVDAIRWEGQSVNLTSGDESQNVEYALVTKRGCLTFTFSVPLGTALPDEFETMTESIRLLKGSR